MPRRFTHLFSATTALLLPAALLADTLSVTIVGIDSADGRVMVQVLHGQAQFAEPDHSVARLSLTPSVDQVAFSLDAMPAGEYAIRVIHDVDGDGELDSNLVGVPTEPWGFSNDAVGSFGPPGWAAVKFTLDGHANQTIHLNR